MPTPVFEPLWEPPQTAQSCAGGCDFATDPSLPASEASVFWLPAWRADAVIFVAGPHSGSTLIYTPATWPALRDRRAAPDGEHLILGVGREEHQLWLPDPPCEGTALAAIIPFDNALPLRTEATIRFARHLKGRRSLAPAGMDHRIVNTFRALDARLNGASYREIAIGLVGADRVSDEPWKSSSVRDVTIRLVRRGVAFMLGGYRKLLTK